MARVKLTEYRAKKIIVGETYKGISIPGEEFPTSGRWVAKVDQGVKKRFKQGLVAVDVPSAHAKKKIEEWTKKGFSNFLLEPFMPHDENEEQYLSFERVREGIRMLHAAEGGIDIEAYPEQVKMYLIGGEKDIDTVTGAAHIPHEFLSRLLHAFQHDHFTFLEINPLIVRGDIAIPLDAAVLVDSAGAFFTRAWGQHDLVKAKAAHQAEARVEEIAKTTPASLKLSVVNPDGALFFLLSGGGGSIVIADEAGLRGAGKLLGNYGEYSGGPTREETYLYAREIVGLMLVSKAKRKALVIAGGVANFTDVRKTFEGIIDALSESASKLRTQGVEVFVRRGGPHEAAGLALMKEFLQREELLGSIHGSDALITQAIDDAIDFIGV